MEKERLSVVFTGDIGFDRYFNGKWKDDALLDGGVLDFLHSADHVCANVEAAVTREGPDGDKGIFFHAMDPEAVRALKLMHADGGAPDSYESFEDETAFLSAEIIKTLARGLDV